MDAKLATHLVKAALIANAKAKLRVKLKREPTPEELAEHLDELIVDRCARAGWRADIMIELLALREELRSF